MYHDESQMEIPLISTYADDEAIGDILGVFINNMPNYIANLERSIGASDWVAAARVCHDLKGTAGGYGYPDIGRAAQELEAELKGSLDAARMALHLRNVKVLCLRARLGIAKDQLS